eukprot:XP_016664917.1 PREDICTED: isocitrate dehydrogenase [NAD] subunit beta, mitochondrial-like isoform X3 [Acyrthosiphon pisum]
MQAARHLLGSIVNASRLALRQSSAMGALAIRTKSTIARSSSGCVSPSHLKNIGFNLPFWDKTSSSDCESTLKLPSVGCISSPKPSSGGCGSPPKPPSGGCGSPAKSPSGGCGSPPKSPTGGCGSTPKPPTSGCGSTPKPPTGGCSSPPISPTGGCGGPSKPQTAGGCGATPKPPSGGFGSPEKLPSGGCGSPPKPPADSCSSPPKSSSGGCGSTPKPPTGGCGSPPKPPTSGCGVTPKPSTGGCSSPPKPPISGCGSAPKPQTAGVCGATPKPPSGRITCTLIPGDGVYPELMNSVQTVLKAIGAPIDFETILFSEVQHSSSAKVEDVIKSINRNRICLMGALMSPDVSYSGELQNLHMKLRKGLDLYSNVVHVVSWPGVASRHKNIDMVIIRELTEGEYSALEHESVDGVVECLKIVTASKSQRIAKFAFDYAIRNNRERVTCVHKANIMKLGDGLFLKSCSDIKRLYPGVNFEAMIVDNCTMQMVSNPQQFDILVMPNLYGNIIDNLAAGLVGGAGVVASSSFSPECAVFEPGARHVFQTAVGKNIANPTAMLMCASKMLRHVNLQHYSESIRNAIREVLAAGKVRTRDLGGSSSTHEFTDAVIKAIV